jgi:hypothetical protein
MSSASGPPPSRDDPATGSLGQLRIEVPHWSAEVRVVDNLFRPVALPPMQADATSSGVYATEVSVPGGVYDVEVRMGERVAQHSLVVRPGKRPAVFSPEQWSNLGMAAAAPVAGTETAPQPHLEAAEHWSRTPTWQGAASGPSRLFLFVRTLEPERYPTFADGLTLREPSLSTAIVDLKSGAEKDAKAGWWAFTADLAPGYFVLSRATGADGVPGREQPIYLMPQWETQIFIPAQEHPSLRNLTLSLARFGQGFRRDDEAALAIEAVFDVLQRGSGARRVVTKEHLATLIEGEHENPWLGVLAAYALAQSLEAGALWRERPEQRESPRQLFAELREYLVRTIGDHPDVAALALPDAGELAADVPAGGHATPRSFPNPPLLRAAVQRVQHYATHDAGAIPAGSLTERVLRRLVTNSPWTAWRPFDGQADRPRSSKRGTTRRRGAGYRPVIESQVFLQSASPRAPIFRFEPPAETAGEDEAPQRSTAQTVRDAELIHIWQSLVDGVKSPVDLPDEISLDQKHKLGALLSHATAEDVSNTCGIPLGETERGFASLRASSALPSATGDSPPAARGTGASPDAAAVQQTILGYALVQSQSGSTAWATVPRGTDLRDTAAGTPAPGAVSPFTIEEAVRALRSAALEMEKAANRPIDATPAAGRLRALGDDLLRCATLIAITGPPGQIELANGALLAFLTGAENQEDDAERRTALEAALRGNPVGQSTITDLQEPGRSWSLRRTVVRDGPSGPIHSYINVLQLVGAGAITQQTLDAIKPSMARLALSASLYAYGSADECAKHLRKVDDAAAEIERLLAGARASSNG